MVKKVMRCQLLGGGGGGGVALKEFLEKKFMTFSIIIFLQYNDNIILFVVPIGFLCVHKTQLSAVLYYYLYGK